jgi:hypothetical protein
MLVQTSEDEETPYKLLSMMGASATAMTEKLKSYTPSTTT